jgi:hypothetical protein
MRPGRLAGADVADLVAFDGDDDVFARRVGFAVDKGAAAEVDDFRRRLGILREGESGEEQGGNHEERAVDHGRILCW